MTDRSELVEAALEVYPEGLALLDREGRVMFWNHAAEIITGYSGADVLGRPIPEALEPLTLCRDCETEGEIPNGPQPGRGSLVHTQHKRGHDVPAVARHVILRDGLGARIGTAAVFHPGEPLNALPHGETSEGSEVRQSQAEIQDRLTREYESFLHEHTGFGVMWIAVDQARELRKTHGAGACEAMLETVERRLANALRAGEEVGRWGDDEFLVLSHEGSEDVFAAHARVLAALARTAEFRWWGDRIPLTISGGAAVADRSETLAQLLERVQAAMTASARDGGNHIALAPGRKPCSPSLA
jgi:PAS domain S-box-containing protein/diguanylate cyclase (GGDEF)-like protein